MPKRTKQEVSANRQVWLDHWARFAEAFIHPLTAGGLLSQFSANTDVTGTYAETWIRGMAKSMLHQFRISTGAIIGPMDQTRNLRSIPQCDIIIWDPSALPALFEQGDFALVHLHSARAIIEVKRTCIDLDAFRKQLKRQQKCLLHELRSNVLGIVISHSSPLFTGDAKPNWPEDDKWQDTPAMTRLLSCKSKRTESNLNCEVDTDGVFVFIYFLSHIAGHKSPFGVIGSGAL